MPTEFNTTTGATLAAQNALNIPKLWEKGAIAGEYSGDVMSRFEGASKESPVAVKTLPVGAGAKMVFRTRTGLGADGVRGDELISNSPGPEEARYSAFELPVDYLRHAAKTNKRAGLVTALADEIVSGFNTDLGDWVGRKKTADLLMMFRHLGNGENYASVNNKTRETLRQGDSLSMSAIVTAGQVLRTLGARPARTTIDRRSGVQIHGFNFFGLGEAMTNLRNSTTYRDAAANAQNRGDENTIFSGGLVKIDNNVIIEWNPEDHDMEAAIGSALNPRAYLGTAITAGTTAIDITGGGNPTSAAKTNHKYFEFFSNYQYRFGVDAGQQLAADTTDRYCIIYNTTGADAGKWGFYRFRTNNGNKLTLHSAVSRLAAAISGVAHTTVGNVTWSAVNTDAHPAGSIVIETNSYGIPFGKTLVLGSMAACRGYSSLERLVRSEEKTEGGFLTTVFIRTIFGQAPFRRLDGRMPNFMVLESAINYAGMSSLPNPA
jgi:hypothetical protein